MPNVPGVVIDPTIIRDDGTPDPAALYVVLDNGEVWGRHTRGGGEWESLGPVPNTPAHDGDEGGHPAPGT